MRQTKTCPACKGSGQPGPGDTKLESCPECGGMCWVEVVPPTILDVKPTSRGFGRADFTDRYGHQASIQESSLATERCIWLGLNEAVKDRHGVEVGARMHLTQDMVRALMPLLQHFIDTGRLP